MSLAVIRAVNYDGGLVGLEVIIANAQGEVTIATIWRYHFPDDIEFVEVFTIYESLKIAKLIRFKI